MSTGTGTDPQSPAAGALTPAAWPAAVRAEDRGRTQIADRVVQRIAARAATEVDLASGTARRLLGLPLRRGGQAPTVDVQVNGQLALVRVGISVAYPAPVRQVTRQVREHVTARVGELTGLQVRQVDIEVTSLTPPSRNGSWVQ